MEHDNMDYFTYKKSKISENKITPRKTNKQKLSALIKIFIGTFLIIFIAFITFNVLFSKKIDIENFAQDTKINNNIEEYSNFEEQQKTIDRRLSIIQQEEHAPSEAKILDNIDKNSQVMDKKQFDKENELQRKKDDFIQEEQEEKPFKTSQENENQENQKIHLKAPINETEKTNSNINVAINFRILTGRYSTFDEAKETQEAIKKQNPKLTPYVRKIGEAYCVQLASYQDFSVAKNEARQFKAKGLDVWIYQQ